MWYLRRATESSWSLNLTHQREHIIASLNRRLHMGSGFEDRWNEKNSALIALKEMRGLMLREATVEVWSTPTASQGPTPLRYCAPTEQH